MDSLPFGLDKTLIPGTERGYRGRQDGAVDPSRSDCTRGRRRGEIEERVKSVAAHRRWGIQRQKECVGSRLEGTLERSSSLARSTMDMLRNVSQERKVRKGCGFNGSRGEAICILL